MGKNCKSFRIQNINHQSWLVLFISFHCRTSDYQATEILLSLHKKSFSLKISIFFVQFILSSVKHKIFSPILLRSFAKDFQYQFNVEIQRKMLFKSVFNPAGNYIFKVNNRNTRTKVWNMFKVNNKDTKKTPLASFCFLYC